jgi:hypothetical protein
LERRRRRTLSRYPCTPDGRYFVVRGRLWRCSNPDLAEDERARLVRELMAARRALRRDAPVEGRPAARAEVERVKTALGERGAVWWTDGSPDYNRKLVKNSPYRDWYESLSSAIAEATSD